MWTKDDKMAERRWCNFTFVLHYSDIPNHTHVHMTIITAVLFVKCTFEHIICLLSKIWVENWPKVRISFRKLGVWIFLKQNEQYTTSDVEIERWNKAYLTFCHGHNTWNKLMETWSKLHAVLEYDYTPAKVSYWW